MAAVLPANNNLANAIAVTGQSGTTTGSNANATKETGEPNHIPTNGGGASVWWSWTAPITGTAVVDTIGSNFDTVMAVYTGNSYPLTLIDYNDDGGGNSTSRITYPATSGTTYKIVVDGWSGATGNIIFNRSLTPSSSAIADWAVYE